MPANSSFIWKTSRKDDFSDLHHELNALLPPYKNAEKFYADDDDIP